MDWKLAACMALISGVAGAAGFAVGYVRGYIDGYSDRHNRDARETEVGMDQK